LVDVFCQFSAHMANVRIEDSSKILHTCHNKGADVTEFAAQGIRTCFEELCRYFTDLPPLSASARLSAGEKSPCTIALARFVTSLSSASLRRRICSNSPPKFSSAFTSSASNLSRT